VLKLELAQIGSIVMPMSKEPVHIYKDSAELLKSLEEWKHRLYLDSWIICAGKHDKEDYPDENGHIEFDVSSQTAKLTLLDPWVDDRIEKHYQEEVLVHELLHLKIGFLKPPENMEGTFFDVMQHRLVYQMAHSLIMAKYNLTPEWFRNDERCR